jgi:hypothetical protein
MPWGTFFTWLSQGLIMIAVIGVMAALVASILKEGRK